MKRLAPTGPPLARAVKRIAALETRVAHLEARMQELHAQLRQVLRPRVGVVDML